MYELRKIHQEATPGPWPEDYVSDAVRHISRNCQDIIESEEQPDFVWDKYADGDFIATFDPQMVGTLLDIVVEAQWFAAAHDGHDVECDRCRFARLLARLTERT